MPNLPTHQARIVLDRPTNSYTPGEAITGCVRVTASGTELPVEMRLELLWQAGSAAHVVQSMNLYSAATADDAEAVFEFRLRAPAGPPSYWGRLVEISWCLRASAVAPELSAEAPFVLTGGEGAWALDGAEWQGGESPSMPAPRMDAWPLASGVTLMLLGLGALATPVLEARHLADVPVHDPLLAVLLPYAFAPLLGLLALLLGWTNLRLGADVTRCLWSRLRTRLAERKLGAVELGLTAESARPGEKIRWSLYLPVAAPVRLRRAHVQLLGHERVHGRRGRTILSQEVHLLQEERQAVVEVHQLLDPLQPFELNGSLRVPSGAAFTFYDCQADPANPALQIERQIDWRLDVHLELEGCPDWHGSVPVLVLPGKPARRTATARRPVSSQVLGPGCAPDADLVTPSQGIARNWKEFRDADLVTPSQGIARNWKEFRLDGSQIGAQGARLAWH